MLPAQQYFTSREEPSSKAPPSRTAYCLGPLPTSLAAPSQTPFLGRSLLPHVYGLAFRLFSIHGHASRVLVQSSVPATWMTPLLVSPAWTALSRTPASHSPASGAVPRASHTAHARCGLRPCQPLTCPLWRTVVLCLQWLWHHS